MYVVYLQTGKQFVFNHVARISINLDHDYDSKLKVIFSQTKLSESRVNGFKFDYFWAAILFIADFVTDKNFLMFGYN